MSNPTDPYVYVDANQTVWFFAPGETDEDDIEINLSILPADDANVYLSHGYPVVIEGVNDDDSVKASLLRKIAEADQDLFRSIAV